MELGGISISLGRHGTLCFLNFNQSIADDLFDLKENNYDIALFVKKKEFTKPKLVVDNIKNLDEKKILQSKNTILIINDNHLNGNMEDDYINSISQVFTDISTIDPEYNISVYGGSDTANRTNGISYISLMRESDRGVVGSDSSTATNIINNIKNKIVAGLSFAYNPPTAIGVQFAFRNIAARNAFNQIYFRNGSSKSFNVTVKASDIGQVSNTDGSFSSALAEISTFHGGQSNFDFKNVLGGTAASGSTLNATVSINGTNKKLTLNGVGELAGPSGTTYTSPIDLNSGLISFDKDKLGTFVFVGISANYNVDSGIIKIKDEIIGTLS